MKTCDGSPVLGGNEIDKEPDARTAGQVQMEINRQKHVGHDLRAVIGDLEGRLSKVLRDNPPEPETCSKDCPCLVGMAAEISEHNDGLADTLSAVRSLLERLEI